MPRNGATGNFGGVGDEIGRWGLMNLVNEGKGGLRTSGLKEKEIGTHSTLPQGWRIGGCREGKRGGNQNPKRCEVSLLIQY